MRLTQASVRPASHPVRASDVMAPLVVHARRLEGHADYVRAACVSPVSVETWATGSYDHTVKLWDVRAGGGGSGSKAPCTLSIDHGAPVESLAFLPSGAAWCPFDSVGTLTGHVPCRWRLGCGSQRLRRRPTVHCWLCERCWRTGRQL